MKDGRQGKLLPFVLCDTMGLEEQSGAGLDIEDISSILQGHVPDRYKVSYLWYVYINPDTFENGICLKTQGFSKRFFSTPKQKNFKSSYV